MPPPFVLREGESVVGEFEVFKIVQNIINQTLPRNIMLLSEYYNCTTVMN